MFIQCLFGLRKESYPGQHAPELIFAADNYTLEECDPGWWETETAKASKPFGDDLVGTTVINIEIGQKGQDKIRDRILGIPTIKGEVTDV